MNGPIGFVQTRGINEFVGKEKHPAAREGPLTTDKYDASLSTARIMSLAVKRTLSSGWEAQ
jgi:hypothetical protein